ncbi:MAG: phosphoribosyltransferase family protein [Candidatus Nitrosocaldus sp.]|nr:phosphoribosyltransferase family protein [Candidatus Nitrosocaldus sp.]MDW8000431.1 phosphoribosyltransferase family protein [Candidatus Nitrosocaldus sp.]
MRERCIDWDEVSRLCSIIEGRIRDDGVSVGCILAVVRGGLVPATIISNMLSVHDLLFIRAIHYDRLSRDAHSTYDYEYDGVGIAYITPIEKIRERVEEFGDEEGRIMLVVDDIADTGLTLKAISQLLTKSIRMATLYMKHRSLLRPDYYADTCSDDEWIVFPWER